VFFPICPFLSFVFSSTSFLSPLFPLPQSGLSQLRDLGSSVSSPAGEKDIATTRHVSLALNTPKMRFAAGDRLQTHFLVYLEPRECVWWLQMSSYFC